MVQAWLYILEHIEIFLYQHNNIIDLIDCLIIVSGFKTADD